MRRVRLLEPTGGSGCLLFGWCRCLWRVRLFVEASASVSLLGRPDSEVVSLLSFIWVAVGCMRGCIRGGLFLVVRVEVSVLRAGGWGSLENFDPRRVRLKWVECYVDVVVLWWKVVCQRERVVLYVIVRPLGLVWKLVVVSGFWFES